MKRSAALFLLGLSFFAAGAQDFSLISTGADSREGPVAQLLAGFQDLSFIATNQGSNQAVTVALSHSGAGAETGRKSLSGHVPSAVAKLTPTGWLAATNNLCLTIGLLLRNQAALDELLRQLYDPRSTNFHKFLTPPEFTARFGPTEEDYRAVIKYAEANGLTVTARHPNRVVLDVEGSAPNVEQAFHVTLRTYRHPIESRDFFAPDTEPSVPANLSVVTVEGLSDYVLPKPLFRQMDPLKARPLGGSGPSGLYAGNDFRNAYATGSALSGAWQAVGLLEFSDYYPVDITNYENTIGLANYVPLNTVVIGHPGPTKANNVEVALDIEMAIAMAPGLSQVIVYEIRNGPSSILSQMANDNLAKQLSSSWTWGGGPSATVDSLFQQMAAQGQSYFQASGDSDAYTGAQTLDNASQLTAPVDSTNVTCVGGTTLTMNGAGVSWSSETVWNYSPLGGADANVGSGGGISTYYTIPYWQTNASMAANSGSTTFRNIPDVALTADGVYVAANNGASGGVAGTSCAAPLWAGFCALVNQQSVAQSGTTVGFLNPALYAIASGGSYANCFHDITTGNNVGANTPGLFNAVAGYDLCTGLGTPNGTSLINALAPLPLPPTILWSFTNLFLAANTNCSASMPEVTGTNYIRASDASGALTISQAPTNAAILPLGTNTVLITVKDSSGNAAYSTNRIVVQDQTPPLILSQPRSQTNVVGATAKFSVSATACTPLAFRWFSNNVALAAGTNSTLTLSNVTTAASGNYFVVATATGGSTTSAVATLTVSLGPPALITGEARNPDGSFSLSFAAGAGSTYVLETKTNLTATANWLPVATNTFGSNGVWQFKDAQATNFQLRFYRLRLAP